MSRRQTAAKAPVFSDAITPLPVRSLDVSAVDSTEAADVAPVLTVPYPVEDCCAKLRASFPRQLGLFVAGRPLNYAYRSNKIAIDQTVNALSYWMYNFKVRKGRKITSNPPSDAAVGEADEQEAIKKAKAESVEQLADALAAESSRLSFVFLRPPQLPWNLLGNCLVFEPNHQLSLFAADKWNMTQILRRRSNVPALRMHTSSGRAFDYRSFTMFTANPGRGQKALLKYLDANPGVYVLKRTNASQGIGIHMYNAERPNTVEKLQRCVGAKARLSHYVLQKYIERPLLIDKRKFDIRVYLLVVSCSCPQRPGQRGYFAFCHPGYVKLSSQAYTESSRDPRVHFTNQWVQRRRPAQYAKVKEATTWLPDELDEYLNRRGRMEAGWCRRRMYRQAQAISGYLAAACRPYLQSQRPCSVFRIYGPDIIVDEALQLRLLEFNCFPCYAKNTVALAASLSGMWREAAALATEVALLFRDGRPIGGRSGGGLSVARNFRLVHSSEQPEVLAELVRSCYP